MRDDTFLSDRLELLWKKYFADVSKSNKVHIKFGRKAVKRLGSIRQKVDGTDTIIILNGYFKDKTVPDYVVDATIIHELCHYAHGFSSPLPQLSRFPHKGGLVDKEFYRRGLNDLLKMETEWLNKNWFKYIVNNQ
ncbi:MAG: hypothetical protein M1324_04305 [Patescibacteria group bacterium]|nr:hypothetical protein [Patescibacteria group bacterium]